MPVIAGNRILVVGRAGMDLYAAPPGTRVELASNFKAELGGSAANIAVACARLGGQVSLFSAVSDDAIGRFVVNQLEHYDINTQHVSKVGGQHRTSLAVVETRAENCQNVLYRNNAADFEIRASDACKVNWKSYDCLIITGTSLAMDPSRAVSLEMMRLARAAGVKVVLDIDYRPYSWKNQDEAAEVCAAASSFSDIVIGNDEEFAVLANGSNSKALARHLASDKLVVYKMGGDGSITYSGDQVIETSVFKVDALKPTGAGDAFMGGFIMSLIDGKSLKDCVTRGSANAAIVVLRVGCAPAMATSAEIDEFIAKHRGPR